MTSRGHCRILLSSFLREQESGQHSVKFEKFRNY